MGDPDASVIPAARDFREGHHAVARLSEHLWRGRDVAFEPKPVLSAERGAVGKTMQLGAEIRWRASGFSLKLAFCMQGLLLRVAVQL
jgi:hypothetical protein